MPWRLRSGERGAAAASSAELGPPLASAWGWAGPGPSSPTAPQPQSCGVRGSARRWGAGRDGGELERRCKPQVPRASPPSPGQGAPSSSVGLGVKPPASPASTLQFPASSLPKIHLPQPPASPTSRLQSPASPVSPASSLQPGSAQPAAGCRVPALTKLN